MNIKERVGRVIFIFFAVFFVPICDASDDIDASDDEEVVASIPSLWAEKISLAYADFSKNTKDVSCFNMHLGAYKNKHLITFIRSDMIMETEEGEFIVNHASNKDCGREISYEFSSSTGEYLGKIYQR